MKADISLPGVVLEVIKRQAETEAPVEACGYLAGKNGSIKTAFPMSNADQSTEHFTLDPREQFRVLKQVREKGLELLAVYHSHPASPARMSEEDKRLACDPDMIYVIYSLRDGEIRGFRVREGGTEEVVLEIKQ